MKKTQKKINPADRTFFSNLFTSIAEEMGVTLTRTAYSPNIKERRDFSCAVFDGKGRMIAQGAHMPVHLGSMPMSVAFAIEAFPEMREGDVVMLNDPYAGGTHLPDITLVSPMYVTSPIPSLVRRGEKGIATSLSKRGDEEAATFLLRRGEQRFPPCQGGIKGGCAFAYLATRAHHADVGGMSPGSMPIAREIYQEGFRIPPIKFMEGGKIVQSVLDLLKANVRTPWEREGDLRAQLAAHAVGERRLRETVEKYGLKDVRSQMDSLLDYGRSLMSALIREIPNGSYEFEDFLDDDGVRDEEIKIKVTLTIKGNRATVDFTGSDPECRGSVNSVEAITRSAVYYCFLCLLVTPSRLLKATLADPPLNAGCFEPIRVIAPEGTIVNARPPRAVAGGNVETSQRVTDVVLGALSKALPDIIPAASQGTMNNLTLGGMDPRTDEPFAYYETIACGMGARPHKDGVDAIHNHMTNTMNTPIEALEFAYPLRIERYEIIPGSGGRGRYRGGCGVRRDVRVLTDTQGSLLCERRKRGPYGLHGGKPGRVGENAIIRDGKRKKLPGKTLLDLDAGDVVSVKTPGGGGWGKTMKNGK